MAKFIQANQNLRSQARAKNEGIFGVFKCDIGFSHLDGDGNWIIYSVIIGTTLMTWAFMGL